jgi:hypothetical protein
MVDQQGNKDVFDCGGMSATMNISLGFFISRGGKLPMTEEINGTVIEAAKEEAAEIAHQKADEAAQEAAEEAAGTVYEETYDAVYHNAYVQAFAEAYKQAMRRLSH